MLRPPFLATIGLLACSLPAPAADPINEGTLTLVDEAGFNELAVDLALPDYNASDSDSSTVTGTIDVRLDINPLTGQSPEFTILGGTIQGTPINLQVKVLFFITVIDVSSSVLGGTLFTTIPPGLMDPLTGEGDAAQHEFGLNLGTVTGVAKDPINSTEFPINMDFSIDPVTGPGAGTSTVSITPADTTATRAIFDVVATFPTDISENVANDAGVTAIFSASGILKAVGEISVPLSDYLAWTETQSIPGADPTLDSNHNGIQNGITWALGLDNTDDPRPHLLVPDPATPRGFLIALPPAGTAGALTIEISPDLSPPWLPADPLELSTGANPLPPGTTGTVTILPSTAGQRFLRLRTDP